MSTKIYDIVKDLLTRIPELRSSDKKLIWAVMSKKQLVQIGQRIHGLNPMTPILTSRVLFMDYMNSPSFESITRARRRVQERCPELRSKGIVKEKRKRKVWRKSIDIH